MLMLIASALRWKAAVPAGWYWYALAIESLILDRATGSVTLEAPSTKFARVRALPSSRGGRTK